MCLPPTLCAPAFSLEPGGLLQLRSGLRVLRLSLSGEQTPGLLTPLGARLGRKCGVGEVARKDGARAAAAAAARSVSASSSSSGALETGGGE